MTQKEKVAWGLWHKIISFPEADILCPVEWTTVTGRSGWDWGLVQIVLDN